MIAVDTNILIYSCDKSDLVRQEKALRFLDEAEDCVIPWQVACSECGINRLYSEDLPGQNPPEGLEIINPFL